MALAALGIVCMVAGKALKIQALAWVGAALAAPLLLGAVLALLIVFPLFVWEEYRVLQSRRRDDE